MNQPQIALSKDQVARMLRQYQAHTSVRANGDKLIRMDAGVYDLFYAKGWEAHSRFRIFRAGGQPRLICISGMHMTSELRDQLIKELA